MKLKLLKRFRKRLKSKPSAKLKEGRILGGTLKYNRAGIRLLKAHPAVTNLVNQIVTGQLKIKSKLHSDLKAAKAALKFEEKKVFLTENKPPFFQVSKRMNFEGYIVERVHFSSGGFIDSGVYKWLYRITSRNGESVLVKIQPQIAVASKIETMHEVRNLGYKTPKYFLEFNFPDFSVQVIEAMKLPNMNQLEAGIQNFSHNELLLINKAFTAEQKKLSKKFDEVKESNCLVSVERTIYGKIKPHFYWIDLRPR
ncbi:hypothetical protein KKG83_01215 [Candidatus Micrarchaeota archaeon]|nr:hypothetical protein [Candidatus Micrarchaeota archaeon]MBU2476068.1 hypothetical protein [Candidatus Micrarchaeota archaeon]